MPDYYVDRGIIKWRPFDALVGYHDVIKNMKYQRAKKNQPIVDEQKQEELEYLMRRAIEEDLEIVVVYFFDGYIKETFGRIIKTNPVYKQIILDTSERFHVSNILDIKLY
ncbi:MAG TPA: hypothetical protein DEA45_04675 [Acholeplasmataceae bacterium]|nr:hypothetical protein [Acholeplasmataceae bacterium]